MITSRGISRAFLFLKGSALREQGNRVEACSFKDDKCMESISHSLRSLTSGMKLEGGPLFNVHCAAWARNRMQIMDLGTETVDRKPEICCVVQEWQVHLKGLSGVCQAHP